MKKIVILVVVVAIIGGAWYALKGSGQQVWKGDSIDTVTQFYGEWLKAAQDSTANPGKAELAQTAFLSPELQSRLADAVKNGTTPDPVLCQAQAPANIATRTLSSATDSAQVIVSPKGSSVASVALVSLSKLGNGWYIKDITCSTGDVAPPAPEFSFEHDGYLLQKSVPKPYNNKNWHLVFSENGENGHLVPLLFNVQSQCVAADGTKSTCNPAKFAEATQVTVHGQLTEAGAQVVRMEFAK